MGRHESHDRTMHYMCTHVPCITVPHGAIQVADVRPSPRLLPLLLLLLPHAACPQGQRCTFSSCAEPCKPCGEAHPGVTFCPSDPNGAQCSSPGGSWTRIGDGLCTNQADPYGQELRTKVPAAYKSNWGPDTGPNGEDRGYGFRYCGPGASTAFTQECEDFCEGLGDCVAIAAGACCFPYRAHCGGVGRNDRSKSQSYTYYELDRATAWGWPLLLALSVILGGYIGGGLLVGTTGGSSGLNRHPHAQYWREIGGLVADGVQFAKLGGRRGAPATTVVVRDQPLLGASTHSSAIGGVKHSRTRTKSVKGSRSSKRSKKNGQGGEILGGSGDDSVAGAAAVDGGGVPGGIGRGGLKEQRVHDAKLHESQAKIQVVGLNSM